MNKLERRLTALATRSTFLLTKAVEVAAERNAALFAKAVEIIQKASADNSTKRNSTELVKLLQGLTDNFAKAKAAQVGTAAKAMEAIETAAMKVANLTQQIITDAADDDHTDVAVFKKKLQMAVKLAHSQIRIATLEALNKVVKSGQRARKYVAQMLKDLGLKLASEIESVVEALSETTNEEAADSLEHEIEADFDDAATEAFDVIVQSDTGVSKRGWTDFWAKVKSTFQQLGATIMAKIKEIAKTIMPQIYEKLTEIGKILLDAAKQLIVEIAGQIFVIQKNTL